MDSGTLTPLLKKMEGEGLLIRNRSLEDERNLIVSLTKKGEDLREQALEIPQKVGSCLNLSREDALALRRILGDMLQNL